MFKRQRPGFYKGKHYIEYVDQVKALKRADKLLEAEQLLLELVDAVEDENRIEQFGISPWYYEQLAVIYRQRADYAAEIAILERGERQPYGKGPLFAERLAKAKALRDKAAG